MELLRMYVYLCSDTLVGTPCCNVNHINALTLRKRIPTREAFSTSVCWYGRNLTQFTDAGRTCQDPVSKLRLNCERDCQVAHWKSVHRGLCPDTKILKGLVTPPYKSFADLAAL